MKYAQIAGCGMYVPSRVVSNQRFVEMGLDTTDEWIATRTGIRQRRLVGAGEATSDLATKAAVQALKSADMNAAELDLVVVATCTPDYPMPSTASLVQDRIGAKNAGAMDVNAACAGFTYALSTSAAQIESGRAKRILIVGADELSIHLDWKDRSTCVLFGDGAGAVVLQASKEPGILASTMGSDGSGAELLMIKAGGSRVRQNGHLPNGDQYLRMNGPQIYRWAVQMMSKAAEKVISASGLKPGEIDLFIPHQANMRIIEATAKKLGLPLDKVFCNVEDYGNTSAASIPIAITEAVAQGRLKAGDNVVLASFGAGLSWSALAMRWGAAVTQGKRRWAPISHELETRVAKMQSALRRQQRKVAARIDERLRREP